MRIAIVSDIHGNRTAFDAVLADLRQTSPDVILHGGDLADSGSSPADVVDHIRDLGWQGVLGNTDEMHTRPESLKEFAGQSSGPAPLWDAVRRMAEATHALLGENRIAWLRELPRVLIRDEVALLHASPNDTWRSPSAGADDAEFISTFGCLQRPAVIYGHVHHPFLRSIRHAERGEMIVANTGGVSLSYDGDPRASYLLIDDSRPGIRRVEYDVEREIRSLSASGLPHSDWVARMLRSASPQLP